MGYSTPGTTLASETTNIAMSLLIWMRLLRQLRRRGRGLQETGAFLLGSDSGHSKTVTAFVCYDDLDPNACQCGAITFHAVGYAALWEYCRAHTLAVIADVHTHPGRRVTQSGVDQRNPMLPVTGHTALIVPCFGRTPWWSLRQIGVYEYLGHFRWRTHHHDSKRLRLSLW